MRSEVQCFTFYMHKKVKRSNTFLKPLTFKIHHTLIEIYGVTEGLAVLKKLPGTDISYAIILKTYLDAP